MRTLIESKSRLYDIIEELCGQRGKNIAWLCKEAGIRPGLLSDLKSGKASSLSMDSLRTIADHLNVSMDVLFDREFIEKS